MTDAKRLAAIKRHWIEAKAEDGFHYWPHRSGSEDIAFLLRELEAGGWRPISEAPNNGDLLLLCDAEGYRWIGYHAFGEDGFEWRSNDESADQPPIVFMPLPAPPGTSDGSDK